MAEDFHQLFRLGADSQHISPSDMAAVGLSSVQALNRVVQTQQEEIQDLRGQVESLQKRLEKLEALLSAPR